ncbi:MAG: hypothetical protein ABIJ08_03260 [Nanoarchaeota archaeon]
MRGELRLDRPGVRARLHDRITMVEIVADYFAERSSDLAKACSRFDQPTGRGHDCKGLKVEHMSDHCLECLYGAIPDDYKA